MRIRIPLSVHTRQQIGRLARLFVAALAAQLVLVHGPVTRDLAAAAVVAAGEAAWRQYSKVGPVDQDEPTR